ncbi:type I 3-dehydroquinate dehydratase [Konateibacter massiliensis]|uniref:type I 3-dehydroquinate dehydratase n=1 Tax=Konateibacter massiliensis TaxID=2002841 RepID=UPI000C1620AB|nr:type I 3-dehydroquinate dehydratase [Konateibacter massiliensis]
MNAVTVKNVTIGEGIPKICIPIVAKTKEEIIQEAKRFQSLPFDIAEWRADWFEGVSDLEQVMEVLKALVLVLEDKPLLFTFRTAKEGGERDITTEEYIALNKAVADSRLADLLDVEIFTRDEAVADIISYAHENGVQVIASNHDFEKTPDKEDIISRLRKMQDMGADIVKLAAMPKSKLDVLVLLEATILMTEHYADRPVITMSMSGMGVISRLAGEIFGSALTFASAGQISAPGQIPVNDLNEVLHILNASIQPSAS